MSFRRRRSNRVRPFTFTGGRTRSQHPLMVQTLVSTSEPGQEPPGTLMPESNNIYKLCRETRSLAEVAAELNIPLRVTQLLVSDLADQDLVYIHPTMTRRRPYEHELLE